MPADPTTAPFGTYADERNPIPSAEGTANPFWIIVTLRRGGDILYHAGPWFSRAAAEAHLDGKRHRYGKSAVVYCASGHMSNDYVHLCQTGRILDAR